MIFLLLLQSTFNGLPTSFYTLKTTECLLGAGIVIEHYYICILHFMSLEQLHFLNFFQQIMAFFSPLFFNFVVPNR